MPRRGSTGRTDASVGDLEALTASFRRHLRATNRCSDSWSTMARSAESSMSRMRPPKVPESMPAVVGDDGSGDPRGACLCVAHARVGTDREVSAGNACRPAIQPS
jgi:hypothetical protein